MTMRNQRIYNLVIIIILTVLAAGCQPAGISNDDSNAYDSTGVEVSALAVNNRNYYPIVYDLFEDAEHSIYMIMYSMKYYDYDRENEEMKLLAKLASRALNGIDVKVILEQSDWNPDLNEDNYASGRYLADNAVEVRCDPMTVTSHCKMIIIDTMRVLVGSTNWSISAINYNNEANVLLTGEAIAEDFTDYFNTLWGDSYEKEFR